MTYVLFFAAVISGLFLKKSKICTVFIVFIMLLLAVYNYQNADIANYKSSYQNALAISSFRYIGFTMIMTFCAKAGLTWIQYRWLFYLIVYTLMIAGISSITKNVNLVLSLYMITYYGIEVVQMKSTLACSIAFFAIVYLINNLVKNGHFSFWRTTAAYAVLCIAILIHFSAVFYLLTALLYMIFYNRRSFSRKLFIISIGLIGAVYIGIIRAIGQFAYQLGIINDIAYLETWFVKKTQFGYLISILFVLAVILSCVVFEHPTDKDSNNSKQTILLRQFVMTSFILIPLSIINSQYMRLIRVYVLLVSIIYASKKIQFKLSKTTLLSVAAFTVVIIMSIYDGTYASFDTTLGAILKYNSIL